jgi:hypothetical protein
MHSRHTTTNNTSSSSSSSSSSRDGFWPCCTCSVSDYRSSKEGLRYVCRTAATQQQMQSVCMSASSKLQCVALRVFPGPQ